MTASTSSHSDPKQAIRRIVEQANAVSQRVAPTLSDNLRHRPTNFSAAPHHVVAEIRRAASDLTQLHAELERVQATDRHSRRASHLFGEAIDEAVKGLGAFVRALSTSDPHAAARFGTVAHQHFQNSDHAGQTAARTLAR
jgi:hypothetical protein